MSIELLQLTGRTRLGVKGPRGGEWLMAHDMVLPSAPNTWTESDGILVARLGSSEFFVEDVEGGSTVGRMQTALAAGPSGVYPVLREDWGFVLRGPSMHDALLQVCNVNFADITPESQGVIMTLMVGISVLVVPMGKASERVYRIWCDPTFGPYLSETLSAVVNECGGNYKGAAA